MNTQSNPNAGSGCPDTNCSLVLGRVYRGRNTREASNLGVYNDRCITYLSAFVVQYDSPMRNMKPRKAVTRKEFEKWAAADVTDQTPKDGWAPYPKPSGWTPPTEEQKAERRKAATHFRRLTLFQLSKPGEDLYPQAWWFNEGSGIWQWHDLTNDEVRRFQPVNASEETPKTKQCPKCSREMVRHNAEYNCLCGYGEIIPENAGAMVRGLAAPDADNTTEIDG